MAPPQQAANPGFVTRGRVAESAEKPSEPGTLRSSPPQTVPGFILPSWKDEGTQPYQLPSSEHDESSQCQQQVEILQLFIDLQNYCDKQMSVKIQQREGRSKPQSLSKC